MVKGRRGRQEHNIPDLGIYPDKEFYRPPKGASERVHTIPLEEGEQLSIRIQDYHGKTVDFAITQATAAKRKWINVARIDCCWGTIHQHLFDRFGNKLKDHELIYEIPTGERGWDFVDSKYVECYDLMVGAWQDNLRRWNCDDN